MGYRPPGIKYALGEVSVRVTVCFFEPHGGLASRFNSAGLETVPFNGLRSELRDNPHGRVALVAPSPVALLSGWLRNGGIPSECLERTCQEARDILSAYRRARRRIFLFDADEIECDPDIFQAAVLALAEAARSIDKNARRPHGASEPRGTSALVRIIAGAMIGSHRKASLLQAEFEASRTALYEWSALEEVALEAALEWKALSNDRRYEGESEQGAANAYRTMIASLQSALDECHIELVQQYERTNRKSNIDDTGLHADLAALRVEASNLRRDNSQLRKALDEIMASTSWKVTEPLRRLRGAPKSADSEARE